MKSYLFILGILTVLSQTHGDCVQDVLDAKPHDVDDICKSEPNWAILPHPHDCNKFYVCANHVPEEYSCAQNYYFDVKKSRCTQGSCSDVEQCIEGWVKGVPGDCQSFQICLNGNYNTYACADGTFYDEMYGMCMPISDTPAHKCNCLLPAYTVIKNNYDCSSYFVCIDRKAVSHQCPHDHYFDPYLNTCLFDFNGSCRNQQTTNPEEDSVLKACERIALNDINSNAVIFQPSDDDCAKFYMCVNGRIMTKRCPVGFYYNREARFCEADYNGNACEAIREQIKKKKEEAEKEAAIKDKEEEHEDINGDDNDKETGNENGNENNNDNDNTIDHPQVEIDDQEKHENEPKPPVKLSLSMTHVKVNVEKGTNEPNHNEKPNQSIMPVELVESEPLKVPVPSILAPSTNEINHSKELPQPEEEEMLNNSAEIVESNSIEMKLPLTDLKLPTSSNFDKLASKFMVF